MAIVLGFDYILYILTFTFKILGCKIGFAYYICVSRAIIYFSLTILSHMWVLTVYILCFYVMKVRVVWKEDIIDRKLNRKKKIAQNLGEHHYLWI